MVSRETERERDDFFFFFDFVEREKAREGESLKIFLVAMLGNGCGALELKETESEDGGVVCESRNGERVLNLLKKGKRVLKAGV